jgi:hypothetical protein
VSSDCLWLGVHALTEFVKHLGRMGQCKLEETEKGWFILMVYLRLCRCFLLQADPAEMIVK